VPKHLHTYHLDWRADALTEASHGADADLLSSTAVAAWLGVTPQCLETWRRKRQGPDFIRVARNRIRYRRDAVLAFLRARTIALVDRQLGKQVQPPSVRRVQLLPRAERG